MDVLVRLAGKEKSVINVFPTGTVQTKTSLIVMILMVLPAWIPTSAGASREVAL